METTNVKRPSRLPQPPGESEVANPTSSMRDQSSGSALVTMITSCLILLLMLAACSPPAQAQALALQASGVDARAFHNAASIGRLTVKPSPEDLPPPAKGRWQRFDEALNATLSRHHRIVETATNDGIRMSCYDPCVMNCCASSGGHSLTGRGFGR